MRDWIEVVAEAPLIDKYGSRVGASVSAEFLDELPVQRFYQSVAQVIPGISGGQDGNPNVSGALRGGNLFLIDGVDTTDPTTGLFGLNLNYEAIQEVHVATAALPAEYGRASGAVLNVVTRSGSNDFQGSLRWLATNNDWNGRYDPPAPEAGYLVPAIDAANAGPDDVNQTVALALGGPVQQDRLWFFAAYEDAESAFLAPTFQPDVRWNQGATLESGAAKLTGRIGRRTTAVLQHTTDSARFAAFTPFNRAATENRVAPRPTPLRGSDVGDIPGDLFSLQDQSQDGEFSKLQWNTAIDQNFSFELTLARQERELSGRPLNSRGVTGDAPHLAITQFARRGRQSHHSGRHPLQRHYGPGFRAPAAPAGEPRRRLVLPDRPRGPRAAGRRRLPADHLGAAVQLRRRSGDGSVDPPSCRRPDLLRSRSKLRGGGALFVVRSRDRRLRPALGVQLLGSRAARDDGGNRGRLPERYDRPRPLAAQPRRTLREDSGRGRGRDGADRGLLGGATPRPHLRSRGGRQDSVLRLLRPLLRALPPAVPGLVRHR